MVLRYSLFATGKVYNNHTMAIEHIRHTPSTNILDITYDDETQTLVIQFQRGGVVEYYGVDATSAHGFENGLSATKYMNAYIENMFPSQRVA